jgi:hypothetical protein
MAHGHWTHPATGSMLNELNSAHFYRMAHVTDDVACRVVLLGDTDGA